MLIGPLVDDDLEVLTHTVILSALAATDVQGAWEVARLVLVNLGVMPSRAEELVRKAQTERDQIQAEMWSGPEETAP